MAEIVIVKGKIKPSREMKPFKEKEFIKTGMRKDHTSC